MENIFQRPPTLMRLTMLTRDKMSLLRAASLRTAWETAHDLNDRKQRVWVEAGILPLNNSRLPWKEARRVSAFFRSQPLFPVLHSLRKGVDLESRFETEQPAKLSRRKRLTRMLRVPGLPAPHKAGPST